MRFAGCKIKSTRLIFKTVMLMYKSKANIDEKNFVWQYHSSFRPKVRKLLVRGMLGNEDSTFHSGL